MLEGIVPEGFVSIDEDLNSLGTFIYKGFVVNVWRSSGVSCLRPLEVGLEEGGHKEFFMERGGLCPSAHQPYSGREGKSDTACLVGSNLSLEKAKVLIDGWWLSLRQIEATNKEKRL